MARKNKVVKAKGSTGPGDVASDKASRLSPITGIPHFYRTFLQELGWKLHGYASLCLLAVVVESLNIIAILPLLTQGAAPEDSRIMQFWDSLLEKLHLANTFTVMLGVVVVTGLLRAFLLSGIVLARLWLRADTEARLRDRFVALMSETSYLHYGSQSHGELNNCLTAAIPGKVVALAQFVTVITGIVFAGGFLIVAFFAEPVIATAAALTGGIAMVVLRAPAGYAQRVGRRKMKESARNQQLVLQYMTNFKYLKASATLKLVGKQIAKSIKRLRNLQLRNFLATEAVNLFGQVLLVVGVAGLLFYLVVHKEQAVAAVMVIALLFYRTLQQIVAMQSGWQNFCNHVGSIDIAGKIEKRLASNKERSEGEEAAVFSESLRLESVSYSYDGSENALSDVSFSIDKGTMVGIAGSSGAGKSTLVDLLTGLLEPTDGRILFDGKDYRELNKNSIRRQLSYVIQEPVVFNDTVEANISMWGSTAETGEMTLDRACRISGFDEVLKELELGYQESVGERGIRLSGGQRQRLSIAREVFRNQPILIFDEATGALDSKTESMVHQRIQQLAGDQTILLIAHRLSTLRNCDKIVALDQGRVVETGTWEELVSREDGFFRSLCDAQHVS